MHSANVDTLLEAIKNFDMAKVTSIGRSFTIWSYHVSNSVAPFSWWNSPGPLHLAHYRNQYVPT